MGCFRFLAIKFFLLFAKIDKSAEYTKRFSYFFMFNRLLGPQKKEKTVDFFVMSAKSITFAARKRNGSKIAEGRYPKETAEGRFPKETAEEETI
jgi:hypothetical protein